jgi:hypothetical protein
MAPVGLDLSLRGFPIADTDPRVPRRRYVRARRAPSHRTPRAGAARMEARAPTGARALREARDRPSARRCSPCAAPHSSDIRRALCTKTRRANRGRTRRSARGRIRARRRHSANSREALLARNAGAVRRTSRARAPGTSRDDRAPARRESFRSDGADDTQERARPRARIAGTVPTRSLSNSRSCCPHELSRTIARCPATGPSSR